MVERILVIDDDQAVRKSFVLALEDTGYHVDTAETGEKGISMQKDIGYNLIFLDLKMPGLNGAETLRELRRVDEITPVYIVTAFHEEFLLELKSLRDDRVNFELLRKPLGLNEIVEITNAVLQ